MQLAVRSWHWARRIRTLLLSNTNAYKHISSNNTEQFKFDFEEIGQNRKMYYIYFIPKKKNERKTQIFKAYNNLTYIFYSKCCYGKTQIINRCIFKASSDFHS